jgi:hypothetical protein
MPQVRTIKQIKFPLRNFLFKNSTFRMGGGGGEFDTMFSQATVQHI